VWFWPALVAGTIADQVSKSLAFGHLGTQYHGIIPNLLGLLTSQNPGGLFGSMPGKAAMLAVLSVIALGLIIWFLYRSTAAGPWLPVAFGLIGSGAVGNFIDRIFNDGKVRDFIFFHVGPHDNPIFRWPIFNIADTLICIGCGMLIYAAFTEKPKK